MTNGRKRARRDARSSSTKLAWASVAPWLLLALVACAADGTRPPPVAEPGSTFDPPLAELLLVVPAADSRPRGASSRIRRGWLAFVPLVPYASQWVSPERVARDAHLLGFDFRTDVADALARDLAASGVARTVARSGLAGASGRPAGGRYELAIELERGVWNRKLTAYGLSAGGMVLWLLGAPNSYGEVELALTAELRDDEGRSLGRTRVHAEVPIVEQVYRSPFWRALWTAYAHVGSELRRFVGDAIRASRAGGPPSSDDAPE